MSFHHLIVPTDFSPLADEALRPAAALARASGARVTVVHTYHEPSVAIPGINRLDAVLGDLAEVAWEKLAGIKARLVAAGVPAERIEVVAEETSDPSGAIVRQPGDLIVMASHGRSGLSRVIMGSVTQEVVHKATCPVMIVKPHAARA